MNKILIIGAGYVGMTNCVYLSKDSDVIFYDIDKEKNKLINNNLKLKTMNLSDVLIDRN